MSLSKDQILAANDIAIVKVPVPEWGGDVFVRSLRANQREELLGLENNQTELFYKLLILTMVNENGTSLGFTTDDITALQEKSLSAIVRVFKAALDINGMTKEAVDSARGN